MSKAKDGITSYLAVVSTGVRGDVLQHLALAVALKNIGGFRVKVVTHGVFQAEVQSYGLEFAALKGDPSALTTTTAFRSALEANSTVTMAALLSKHTDSYLEPNMSLIHDACKSVDAIICSIAVLTECLAIGQKYQRPVLLAPLLPYSPSGELPLIHVLPKPLEYQFLNKLSYDCSGLVLWAAAGPAFNRFRTRVLNIGQQTSYMLEGVPQIAAFSSAAVPRPSDWGKHVHQTSYWVLPEPVDRIAVNAPRLHAVLSTCVGLEPAKRPLVVTFEGLPIPDTVAFLRSLHKLASKLGVCAVLLAGAGEGGDKGDWATLRNNPKLQDLTDVVFDMPGLPPTLSSHKGPVPAQPRLIVASTVPYGWLFPQAGTIVHHGGALVTQAAWASGVPAVAFPAFGDQWFWAARITACNIGPQVVFPIKEAAQRLEECVALARTRESIASAANLGNAIRSAGNGVTAAVMLIRDILSRPQHRHCGVTCSWTPDESRLSCSICEGPFTLMNRRRHCRSCGRLACTKCLTQRCHLPGFPEDAPQLTCTTCLDHRRAFFAMHVGESAVPPVPGAAQAALSAQVTSPGMVSPGPRGVASVLSPGAAADLADGFAAVDLRSSSSSTTATAAGAGASGSSNMFGSAGGSNAAGTPAGKDGTTAINTPRVLSSVLKSPLAAALPVLSGLSAAATPIQAASTPAGTDSVNTEAGGETAPFDQVIENLS